MNRVQFNANQYIYVRLTELGVQLLRDQAAELRQRYPFITTPLWEPVPDERGFYEFQLWDFMATFGPSSGLGSCLRFHMDVEFRAEDLTPVPLDGTP
jgi:hypothetical protein